MPETEKNRNGKINDNWPAYLIQSDVQIPGKLEARLKRHRGRLRGEVLGRELNLCIDSEKMISTSSGRWVSSYTDTPEKDNTPTLDNRLAAP